MEVMKRPGSITRYPVSPEDMALINDMAKSKLSAEEVYTFAVRLCDNEIDRDWERFDRAALEALGKMFVGKTGIFDHSWTAEGQTARLYKTELCREEGVTEAGEGRCYLKGCAYMLRSEKNRELISEIEAGIKKEVSVGCSVARSVCSICGQEHCSHQRGQSYGGKLCYFTLSDPTDAYEWSFVAVPAQRKAGVIKAFAQEGRDGLRKYVSGHPGYLQALDQLEQEARLGRAYMDGLRKDVVRLAGLAEKELDLNVFAGAAARLTESELLELKRVYQHRVDQRFPAAVQLRPAAAGTQANDEDAAFLI